MNSREVKHATAYENRMYRQASDHEEKKDILWPEEKIETERCEHPDCAYGAENACLYDGQQGQSPLYKDWKQTRYYHPEIQDKLRKQEA